MAYTINANARPAGFLRAVTPVLAALGDALVAYMERNARLDEIRRLEALSDSELAARGIARDRIAHHVFQDKFYV
ncbi:hypothetical protein LZA78_05255 [Sinirhodobacter sp. WL0062]|uniref:DUF1127 domain-containing protein n=1 Tax=Rhodobacter flavimaris TaxID=2907145 RepID=A0ABS8YSM9_9RHOB|nr:hypothetical protein [Sinirhodobacter sp. WL0062]MCE5972879.1 hypothetical protein [Sinirhodobacter sp. WL0062]